MEEVAAGREKRSRDGFQVVGTAGGGGGGAPHLCGGQVEQGGGGVGGNKERPPADRTDCLLQEVGGQGRVGGGEVHRGGASGAARPRHLGLGNLWLVTFYLTLFIWIFLHQYLVFLIF